MHAVGLQVNINAYLASRDPREAKRLRTCAGLPTGHLPARTPASTIVPPRDVRATLRYKLPTRKELFAYAQMVDPKPILATERPIN